MFCRGHQHSTSYGTIAGAVAAGPTRDCLRPLPVAPTCLCVSAQGRAESRRPVNSAQFEFGRGANCIAKRPRRESAREVLREAAAPGLALACCTDVRAASGGWLWQIGSAARLQAPTYTGAGGAGAHGATTHT